MNVRDSRVHNYPPRWNGAPSQDLLVIRRNRQIGEVSLDPLRWGLIPYWCGDPKGGRTPINAKCETVRTLPTFRDAYQRRRCIVPVDGFFEWKARVKNQSSLYAIAMKDGSPFGLGGYQVRWQTDYETVKAQRGALAKEYAELYPLLTARLCDLFHRVEALDQECSRINGEEPAGDHRRLLGVELTARKLAGFSTESPSIAKELKLPDFDHRPNGVAVAATTCDAARDDVWCHHRHRGVGEGPGSPRRDAQSAL
jgi:SOS response associated peptidase (SRAP)